MYVFSIYQYVERSMTNLKGVYLGVSHLTELKNIGLYITEKQYKWSISKNHTIKNKFDGAPLKGYLASYVIFRVCARNNNNKKSIVGRSSD